MSLSANTLTKAYYHLAQNKIESSIDWYQKYLRKEKKHNTEYLEELAMNILESGIRSKEPELQMLSLFGASYATPTSSLFLCDKAMHSKDPMAQLAAIRLLGQLQDDRAEELFVRAFNSQYLPIRFEAGYQLALRKSKAASGLFQSLMHHLPEQFQAYFPDLFAMIGTKEALSILNTLLQSKYPGVKLATVHAIAKFGKEQFIPHLRTMLTHNDASEQEAAVYALGVLKDLHSKEKLKELALSKAPNVSLAAYKSLVLLGDHTVFEQIKRRSLNLDPFAIHLLEMIPTSHDTLSTYLLERDENTRINAALALLAHRDPRALPEIEKLLIPQSHAVSIAPTFSQGGSLMAWKVTHNPQSKEATLMLREHILQECIQYSENAFLHLSRSMFQKEQLDLIPTTVRLLEQMHTKGAEDLLKEYAEKAGSPLIRGFCRLSLFRLGKYPKQPIVEWVMERKGSQHISFRPLTAWAENRDQTQYSLTPEDQSRLFIESVASIADMHQESSIDLLLRLIVDGNKQNRYALSGLLLHAIQ